MMNARPSTGEHYPVHDEQSGGSQMDTKAAAMIKEMKEIRTCSKLTYMDIMESMAELDESSIVSLSTLRRIFRDNSEAKAASFNFDETLTPAYNAVKALEGKPKDDSPYAKELDGYKAVIRVQNEELDRLLELKEHLDDRVDFLVRQIDTKDSLINYLMKQLNEKDETIHKLMDKCL